MLKVLENPSRDAIKSCIKNHEDFRIQNSSSQSSNVELVEGLLENAGYDVRVKTKGREASLIVPLPWNVFNFIGQVAHNVATYNPDWVISKDIFGSGVDVKFYGKG